MKLQEMSDLHFEFHKDGGASFINSLDPTGIDVLVLAGDIFPLKDYQRAESIFDAFMQKYQHVIYVVGNHEFYGSDKPHVERSLDRLRAKFPNLHAFHSPGSVSIKGQNFICGTMWYPQDPMDVVFEDMMADKSMIKGFKSWVYDESQLFEHYVNGRLVADDVVITHYLPSSKSIAAKYKGSQLNRFFLYDMEKLILERQPKLWVHGHTHESCNYMIGSTGVVCNPLGYPREQKSRAFSDQYIIEV